MVIPPGPVEITVKPLSLDAWSLADLPIDLISEADPVVQLAGGIIAISSLGWTASAALRKVVRTVRESRGFDEEARDVLRRLGLLKKKDSWGFGRGLTVPTLVLVPTGQIEIVDGEIRVPRDHDQRWLQFDMASKIFQESYLPNLRANATYNLRVATTITAQQTSNTLFRRIGERSIENPGRSAEALKVPEKFSQVVLNGCLRILQLELTALDARGSQLRPHHAREVISNTLTQLSTRNPSHPKTNCQLLKLGNLYDSQPDLDRKVGELRRHLERGRRVYVQYNCEAGMDRNVLDSLTRQRFLRTSLRGPWRESLEPGIESAVLAFEAAA